MKKQNERILKASFRDPAGFLFFRGDKLYRQLNHSCQQDYERLMDSGLYQQLVENRLLIPHQEVDIKPARAEIAYKIIQPERLPFISYPYEWCFSQLKSAALSTLKIQKMALDHGMTLKDASAYNLQFQGAEPIFIDTLSFQIQKEGEPWPAYRQFCQHFLAPLALMSYCDIRLNKLFRVHLDGIPLDLASSLLPLKSRFSFSLLSHLHLHARGQNHFAQREIDQKKVRMGKLSLRGIIDSLEGAIKKLKWEPNDSTWSGYYQEHSYSETGLKKKKQLVKEFLETTGAELVWDLGANTGLFSRLTAEKATLTLAFDLDPACVERNYRQLLKDQAPGILPLVLDLRNPSPGLGWEHKERNSLKERGPADLLLSLALVHHLALGNNLPLERIAEYFSSLGKYIIIEFIPLSDPRARGLVSGRENLFSSYTQQNFEQQFSRYYQLLEKESLPESERVMYLMEGK